MRRFFSENGFIYIKGKHMNEARLDRSWPFYAEVETKDPRYWIPADSIFPGSYIQASHLWHRVPDTKANRKFLNPSLRKILWYAVFGEA